MVNQYEVYLVNLDPTFGYEIKKTRPCVIISPNELNHNLNTVIIAPLTTKSHNFNTRIPLNFQNKDGWIVLDQIRSVDRFRLIKNLGTIDPLSIYHIKLILKEMLVD